ncbi:hypothetical protein [Vibrio quintilis]|uniref:hypothetical protein n=1 Tax=Vibrio quintilis TaxID=1117707 RepID=UPI000937257A|nr:hypothetical protein [Vibrio quintilis]
MNSITGDDLHIHCSHFIAANNRADNRSLKMKQHFDTINNMLKAVLKPSAILIHLHQFSFFVSVLPLFIPTNPKQVCTEHIAHSPADTTVFISI